MKLQPGTHPTRFRLPPSYSMEIGRTISRWAFLEWRIKQIGYLLVFWPDPPSKNPKVGRLVVREPRIDDYTTMIKDLMKLRRLSVSVNINAIHDGLKDLERNRDALAHGVWVKHSSTKIPMLQVLKGKWSHPSKPKTKRIVDPEGIPITLKQLRDNTRAIGRAVTAILMLEAELSAQRPSSPQKSSEP